jgi:signal transduction histidine kinase
MIIEQRVAEGQDIEVFEKNIGDKIIVKEIPGLSGKKPFFTSVKQKEEFEEAVEGNVEEDNDGEFDAQAFVFEITAKGKNYQITVIKAYDNDEELGENILSAVIISAILMIVSIVLVNIFIYKKIWAPFYFTLKQVRNFNISKRDTINFPKTKTTEFHQLNIAIKLMAEKILKDYLSLKEFTENASHEIQTPLAIINSKIEICLQDTSLSSEQAKLLIEASHAVNALVNLNKGLITLTKLDNNQIDLPSEVNLHDKIFKRLSLFEDFIQEKDIDVNYKIDKTVTVKINSALAGILFDNLIKNAIKHNFKGGKINIEITKEFFKISNTGAKPKIDTDKFFERFYKENTDGSLGLGLAIVKKICEIYGFKITYDYTDEMHIITLVFPIS